MAVRKPTTQFSSLPSLDVDLSGVEKAGERLVHAKVIGEQEDRKLAQLLSSEAERMANTTPELYAKWLQQVQSNPAMMGIAQEYNIILDPEAANRNTPEARGARAGRQSVANSKAQLEGRSSPEYISVQEEADKAEAEYQMRKLQDPDFIAVKKKERELDANLDIFDRNYRAQDKRMTEVQEKEMAQRNIAAYNAMLVIAPDENGEPTTMSRGEARRKKLDYQVMLDQPGIKDLGLAARATYLSELNEPDGSGLTLEGRPATIGMKLERVLQGTDVREYELAELTRQAEDLLKSWEVYATRSTPENLNQYSEKQEKIALYHKLPTEGKIKMWDEFLADWIQERDPLILKLGVRPILREEGKAEVSQNEKSGNRLAKLLDKAIAGLASSGLGQGGRSLIYEDKE